MVYVKVKLKVKPTYFLLGFGSFLYNQLQHKIMESTQSYIYCFSYHSCINMLLQLSVLISTLDELLINGLTQTIVIPGSKGP